VPLIYLDPSIINSITLYGKKSGKFLGSFLMVELTVTVVVSGLGSGRLCVCYGVWIRGERWVGGKGTLGSY